MCIIRNSGFSQEEGLWRAHYRLVLGDCGEGSRN